MLVASHHDKLEAFGDLNRARVLEGPHVLDLVALLEYHVLLQRHVMEFRLILRIGLDGALLPDEAL